MSAIAKHELAAKVSEQAERYKDMMKHVRAMVQAAGEAKKELTTEQRNLLSVAYKNVVGACRSAFRALNAGVAEKQLEHEIATAYRTHHVEVELREVCMELISLVDGVLSTTEDQAGKLFFLKMKGDYFRYLAETEGSGSDSGAQAAAAYEEAANTGDLKSTNPIRLGLALNHSVFLYEIQNKKEEATALAKKAFDAAIAELDELDEESYKDATLIMQLIRDNLTLWSSEGQQE